jgi:TPR repeat protein
MIGVKDGLALPAHVQFSLGKAYEEGYLTTAATAAQARKIAMKYFNNAAGAGSAPAAERMGHFYEHGFDVPKSYTAASGWYGKAAEKGNAKAQYALGRILSSGMGMADPKPEAAVRWWELAAEQTGNDGDALTASAAAMVSLGFAYRLGMGVTRNEKEAAFYFQRAADTGVSPEGMFELGECYRRGAGVPKPSVDTAVHFYKKAALQGYDKANRVLISLGLFSTEGKGGVKRYVPRPDSCARCGKHESEFEVDVMLMCRRCHAVGYCSKECKSLHFREAHCEECGTLTTLNEQFEEEHLSPPSSPRHDPATWEQFTDHKTGDLYWYNNVTGMSTWDLPRGKNYYK